MYLKDVEKLSDKDKAYNGLIRVKIVNVRQKRICRACGKDIQTGETCYTAEVPKRKGITYRFAVDRKLPYNIKEFKLYRQWICADCFKKLRIINAPNLKVKVLDTELFRNLPYESQLDVVNKLYKSGELTAREAQEIEDDLIHAIAFRDATMDDF